MSSPRSVQAPGSVPVRFLPTSVSLPADVVKMLPFIVVMLTLIVFSRRTVVPPALAVPYVRGTR